jgi:hypothetical protein
MDSKSSGFAIRLINRDLVVDTLLSDELNNHNQAMMEFLMAVQEDADEKLESEFFTCTFPYPSVDIPLASVRRHRVSTVNVKPFLKVEEGNPFYVIPVVSEPLFPQFKGAKPRGVIRAKGQKGG